MEWLLRHVPKVKIAAENGVLSFGTVDSWLAYHLTDRKAYVTDVSNASRTMLLNLRTTAWDDTCLSLFRLRREMLPTVVTSSEIVGHTPSGIPIASMIGDQQGALFGQMCFEPGQAKCTYGTGAFLLMNVGTEPKFSANRLLTTIAWKAGNELAYAMEGSVFICGASIDWIVNELGLAPNAASTEQMAYNVRDNGGVYFVPALSGLGAPYWDPQARGLWIGMTQATNRNHLTRSVLEGIAYSVRDLSDTIVTDSGIPLKELKIDGGVSKNTFLQNYQSTVLGLPVLRPKNTETTATGHTKENLAKLGLSLGEGFVSPTGALFSPKLEIVGRSEPMYDPGREVEEAIFDHFAVDMDQKILQPSPDAFQAIRLKVAEASKNNPLLAKALAASAGVSDEMDLVSAAKAAAVVETLDEIAFGYNTTAVSYTHLTLPTIYSV